MNDEDLDEKIKESKDVVNPFDKIFGTMTVTEEINEFSEVINKFFNDDENIDLKTEIHNPKAVASLMLVADYCKQLGQIRPAKVLYNFAKYYKKLMVSYKRGGRKEFFDMEKFRKQMESDEELE